MPNLVYQYVYHRVLEVDRTLENYLNVHRYFAFALNFNIAKVGVSWELCR